MAKTKSTAAAPAAAEPAEPGRAPLVAEASADVAAPIAGPAPREAGCEEGNETPLDVQAISADDADYAARLLAKRAGLSRDQAVEAVRRAAPERIAALVDAGRAGDLAGVEALLGD